MAAATSLCMAVSPDSLSPWAELQAIVDCVRELANASGVAIAMTTDDAEKIHCRVRSGSTAPELGVVVLPENSLTKDCISSGKQVQYNDAEADGVRSVVITPICHEGRVRGVLVVFSSTAQGLDAHLERLQTAADQVARILWESQRPVDMNRPVGKWLQAENRKLEAAASRDSQAAMQVAPEPEREKTSIQGRLWEKRELERPLSSFFSLKKYQPALRAASERRKQERPPAAAAPEFSRSEPQPSFTVLKAPAQSAATGLFAAFGAIESKTRWSSSFAVLLGAALVIVGGMAVWVYLALRA